MEQHCLNNAVDGSIRSNAEGKGQKTDYREAWRPAQLPQSKLHVGPDALHGGPLPHLAAAFFQQGNIAELAASSTRSFLTRHAIVHQLFDGFIEVFSYRLGEFVVTAATGEAPFEPAHTFSSYFSRKVLAGSIPAIRSAGTVVATSVTAARINTTMRMVGRS
jgi:hypothetical protein